MEQSKNSNYNESIFEFTGIVPFLPRIMAAGEKQLLLNTSECFCSDLQHEDYTPLYAWMNYIVIIVMLPLLSVFGVLTNVMNVFVFSRRRMRNSANTYLLFLACSDFMVIVTGLFIFWTDSARSYIPQLARAPYTTVYTLPFGYMAQSCSIYFTVAAAFDCYICVCWRRFSKAYCTVDRAQRVVMSIVFGSIVYNSFRFPQFNLRRCLHSVSQEEIIEICPTSLFYAINTVYNVYLYMIVMTLLPFVLLLVLNALIIYRKSVEAHKMRKQRNSIRSQISAAIAAHNQQRQPETALALLFGWTPPLNTTKTPTITTATASEVAAVTTNNPNNRVPVETMVLRAGGAVGRAVQKRSVAGESVVSVMPPSAAALVASGDTDDTLTMIMVVVLFLCCNTLSLVVNLIETFFEPDPQLLNLLSDTSNFLVIFNSSVNCVIYLIFNGEYRNVLQGYLFRKRRLHHSLQLIRLPSSDSNHNDQSNNGRRLANTMTTTCSSLLAPDSAVDGCPPPMDVCGASLVPTFNARTARQPQKGSTCCGRCSGGYRGHLGAMRYPSTGAGWTSTNGPQSTPLWFQQQSLNLHPTQLSHRFAPMRGGNNIRRVPATGPSDAPDRLTGTSGNSAAAVSIFCECQISCPIHRCPNCFHQPTPSKNSNTISRRELVERYLASFDQQNTVGEGEDPQQAAADENLTADSGWEEQGSHVSTTQIGNSVPFHQSRGTTSYLAELKIIGPLKVASRLANADGSLSASRSEFSEIRI